MASGSSIGQHSSGSFPRGLEGVGGKAVGKTQALEELWGWGAGRRQGAFLQSLGASGRLRGGEGRLERRKENEASGAGA